MNTEQENDCCWGAYFDGDERVTVCKSEGEARGELEATIDADHEPGEQIEYLCAPMVSGKQRLRKIGGQWVGEDLFERINEVLDDDMGSEEYPLGLTMEDRAELGELVIEFICARAKVQWWTVDQTREQKHTYVAGSNDAVEALPNTEAMRHAAKEER